MSLRRSLSNYLAACLVAVVLVAVAPALSAAFAVVEAPGASAFTALAWADDPAEGVQPASGDNLVNPQQLPDSSFIYDTSISDLESADAYLDKQTVQVTGEVVGDRIRAELDGDHCWILLQAVDGSNSSVSVYMSGTSADLIDTYGAYGKSGTVLQVRGTFNLACRDHEGLSDLHADHVSVVSKGFESPDEFEPAAMVPGVVMVVAGIVLVFVFYRMRESRR